MNQPSNEALANLLVFLTNCKSVQAAFGKDRKGGLTDVGRGKRAV